MTAVLLLVDLQHDFLEAAGLEPSRGQVEERGAALLAAWRARGLPVVHLMTTVRRSPDNRMGHWKRKNLWRCEEGTAGHEPPETLATAAGEAVVHKQHFSGFETPELERALEGHDTVVMMGVHLHGCIRATALDAEARGFAVWVVGDAVGSDDPVHAAITRRYLSERSTRFLDADAVIASLESAGAVGGYGHVRPAAGSRVAWREAESSAAAIEAAARRLAAVQPASSPVLRIAALERLAAALLEQVEVFAGEICADVGKPITMARAEVRRSAALLRATAREAARPQVAESAAGTRVRRVPLGVVGVVTPWNNPLAIPVGKLAPALAFGNAALWKPAPAGTRVARRLFGLWRACDGEVPLAMVTGDHAAAMAVAGQVDGLTVSGSLAAGRALSEIALRRHLPWQAELGGNNAAILWTEDVAGAARVVVSGALGFAGQRCTANRRAIVPAGRLEEWCAALVGAARELAWGDPASERTIIGPVISAVKAARLDALIGRVSGSGCRVIATHVVAGAEERRGAFVMPRVVVCGDPSHEIVQEESFGPILMIQPAETFAEAMALCNGVRQGLVAALFGGSGDERRQFVAAARCGVVKLDQSTSDADAESPFGGWKASGAGPAEHGSCDRDFYTRVQTIYGGDDVGGT